MSLLTSSQDATKALLGVRFKELVLVTASGCQRTLSHRVQATDAHWVKPHPLTATFLHPYVSAFEQKVWFSLSGLTMYHENQKKMPQRYLQTKPKGAV